MSAHTKEPWRFWPPINVERIGRITHSEKAKSVMVLDDANARRIVACVNACAGIPTDALEDATLNPALDDYERLMMLSRHAQTAATET